jgi:circadian clock protein KaiB
VTEPTRWSLTLYVSGASPRSAAAVDAVQKVCAEDLAGRADLQIVDVRDDVGLVLSDQVLAVPTLVKRLPAPLRRLVGDLEDVERLRAGLDLEPMITVRAGPAEKPAAS